MSVHLTGLLALPIAARAQSLEFGPPYTATGGFENPFGVAVDRVNNHLIVADTRNRQLRFTSVAALANQPAFRSFGYAVNPAAPEALVDPQGVAADASGNVYVVDTRKNNVKLYRWNAALSTYVLDPAFLSNSVLPVPISWPRDIATGPDGKVYLLDSGNKRILRLDGPNDSSWDLFVADATLGHAYGIGVGPDGRVYVADTDHHRIVRYSTAGAGSAFGQFGTGPGQFRSPRDVAADVDGRMYVVDAHNHRVEIIDENGHHVFAIGRAPTFAAVQKIALGADRQLFVVDGDRDAVVAFLGSDVPIPFDAWMRDYVGDVGVQPSDPAFTLASPDILVRQAADVDLAVAATTGLENITFQQPRFERDNFVYVTVRNRGTQELRDAVVRLYWADPGTGLLFPSQWNTTGFTIDQNSTTTQNLMVPPIPPGGRQIIGPVRWTPPAPEQTAAGDGNVLLGVRIIQAFDVAASGQGEAGIRASNNVAVRKVKIARAPFATGTQNTLVVRVGYADDATQIDENAVIARVDALSEWIREVSWQQASVVPLLRGQINLPRTRAHYASPTRNRLVEMATDALSMLLSSEPELLNGTAAGPEDDIDRLLLVTNDGGDAVDWATTEAWPYQLSGGERYMTVSVVSANSEDHALAHSLSHQFGMLDLFAYPNVTLPYPLAEGWDNMARPMTGVHPTVWSKELATWVAEHNADVLFIPRPARGATYAENNLPLHFQATSGAGQRLGIAIGLTPGIGTLSDETAFYYLEARASGVGAADAALPGSGVLMYYVNRDLPQGEGPLMVRDHKPATPTLADAAIPVGETESPDGTGISVHVQSGGDVPGGFGFQLNLSYTPPASSYDVSIRKGDPEWVSPDIWVDNQSDGYDVDQNRTPTDRGDLAIGGEENRIYARIHNAGEADAFDIEVAFFISEPYHTVGGEGDFTYLRSVIIPRLQPGETTVFIPWTPSALDPHSCVRVVLRRLGNDANAANNNAQQNMDVMWSTSASPYAPVNFKFQITNPTAQPQLVYFRADQIPAEWSRQFSPASATLSPGQKFTGTLTLRPPETATNCTAHFVYVTAWTPEAHTLVRLGGTTVNVNLARKANMNMRVDTVSCADEDYKKAYDEEKKGGTEPDTIKVRSDAVCGLYKPCVILRPKGCTNPAQPGTEVILRYKKANGKPIYRSVKTNAEGCFEDRNTVTEGGSWQVTASIAASKCLAPVSLSTTVTLGATDTVAAPSYGRDAAVRALHFEVRGGMKLGKAGAAPCASCRTRRVEHALRAELETTNRGVSGDLLVDYLITAFANDGGAGVHSGMAVIVLKDGSRVEGSVEGMTDTTAHSVAGIDMKHRLEGMFVGRAVEGPHRGCRLVLQYSLQLDNDPRVESPAAKGRADGAWDCPCKGSAPAALSAAPSIPDGCVLPVSLRGKGVLGSLSNRRAACGGAVSLQNGRMTLRGTQAAELRVDTLVHFFVSDANSAAVHAGIFELSLDDGSVVRGRLQGLTNVNPHRDASSVSPRHFEGALSGPIVKGRLAGCELRGVYSADYDRSSARSGTPTSWTIEGAIVCNCGKAADRVRTGSKVDSLRLGARSREPRVTRGGLDSILTARVGTAERLSAADRKLADRNRDGRVSQLEVAELHRLREQFERQDGNRDSYISLPELEREVLTELRRGAGRRIGPLESERVAQTAARSRFRKLDGNRDGRISFAESLASVSNVMATPATRTPPAQRQKK